MKVTGTHVSTTTPINGDMLKKELKKRGLYGVVQKRGGARR